MKMVSGPRSRRDVLLLGTAAGAAVLMDSALAAQVQRPGADDALPAIDVKSYGAVGDAREDNSAAFQRALDAAGLLAADSLCRMHRRGSGPISSMRMV
jgi:hypothetical protein